MHVACSAINANSTNSTKPKQKKGLMKNFELTRQMLTMSGVFYPTGYAFLMFANVADAEQVAHDVDSRAHGDDLVMLLSPETVESDIGKADGTSDVELPSVGTEGATVRKYVDLAREGHWALMVKLASDEEAERLMVAARKASFSYAQRYHLLAIEDLE